MRFIRLASRSEAHPDCRRPWTWVAPDYTGKTDGNGGVAATSSRAHSGERRCRRVTLSVRAMRILDRYIVREGSRPAFLGLVVFTFVLFVPRLVQLMQLFVRHTGSRAQVLNLLL